MFLKRKIKKLCNTFKSPDISDRIPELSNPPRKQTDNSKKYQKNLKKTALAIACSLLFAVITIHIHFLMNTLYGTNNFSSAEQSFSAAESAEQSSTTEYQSSEVVEQSASSEAETIETPPDNRKIICGKYIGKERPEALAEDGALLIEEVYLAKALKEHEGEDVLYGVYIHLEGTAASKIPTIRSENASEIKYQYQKNEYVFEDIYAHFETFGVVIVPVSPEECIHLCARPYTVYRAKLTSDQIYGLRNTDYGVFITFSDEEANFYQE